MFRVCLLLSVAASALCGVAHQGQVYKLVAVQGGQKSQGTYQPHGPYQPQVPYQPQGPYQPQPTKAPFQPTQQPYKPERPYEPAPVRPQKPAEEETYAPRPYEFAYMADADGGSSSRTESSDGSGKVQGSYTVVGDDGRTRTVEYVADKDGFRANVKTNEQGTESKNPANVVLESSAAPVDFSAYTPEAGRHQGYNKGQTYQPQPQPQAGGAVKPAPWKPEAPKPWAPPASQAGGAAKPWPAQGDWKPQIEAGWNPQNQGSQTWAPENQAGGQTWSAQGSYGQAKGQTGGYDAWKTESQVPEAPKPAPQPSGGYQHGQKTSFQGKKYILVPVDAYPAQGWA